MCSYSEYERIRTLLKVAKYVYKLRDKIPPNSIVLLRDDEITIVNPLDLEYAIADGCIFYKSIDRIYAVETILDELTHVINKVLPYDTVSEIYGLFERTREISVNLTDIIIDEELILDVLGYSVVHDEDEWYIFKNKIVKKKLSQALENNTLATRIKEIIKKSRPSSEQVFDYRTGIVFTLYKMCESAILYRNAFHNIGYKSETVNTFTKSGELPIKKKDTVPVFETLRLLLPSIESVVEHPLVLFLPMKIMYLITNNGGKFTIFKTAIQALQLLEIDLFNTDF